MENGLFRHLSKQKAVDHAIWLNFSYRTTNIRYGAIPSIEGDHLVVSINHPNYRGKDFVPLPMDYSKMSYDNIKWVRMDEDPLPHWEAITGMFSVMDGEVLRFLLAHKVPLKRFIRWELANRGHDKEHRWVGFDRSAKIWLKQ